MNAQEFFESDIQIPSLPDVYYDFKDAMDNPEASFEEISDVIATDPGLSARLLRIVNSAYFGFPSEISSIRHATSVVGLEQLNNLVISTVIIDRFKGIPDSIMNMQSFWKHSIACGMGAKIISSHAGEANKEFFFVAGMLHDIGRLIIALVSPFNILSVFMRCKSENIPLQESEQDILGFTHADIGKHLLKVWGLPVYLQEVVGNHHQPEKMPNFSKEASIIHVADQLVNSLELGDSGETIFPSKISSSAWKKLGLPKEITQKHLCEEIYKNVSSTLQVFLPAA
ncbi:MAG: HDOD domain-containing protein [Nitrospina sp.]|nr:HDOD domain-containing protein [Nitrospina sp.]